MKLSPADIATALANGGNLSKSVAEMLAGPVAATEKCGFCGDVRATCSIGKRCNCGGRYEPSVAAPPPAPQCSEKEFQARVIAYAQERGWIVYHTHDSRRSKAGFPDLTMVRLRWHPTGEGKPIGRVIFAELKAETGKESNAQMEWRRTLEVVGGTVEAYLLRPSDWPKIVELLR